jgi:hypothetical protein
MEDLAQAALAASCQAVAGALSEAGDGAASAGAGIGRFQPAEGRRLARKSVPATASAVLALNGRRPSKRWHIHVMPTVSSAPHNGVSRGGLLQAAP